MTALARRRFDKADFLDWLERQERRYELVDGYPVLLPNVTRNHQRVVTNIVLLLGRLDPQRYEIAQGDFAVETGEHHVRYADVMVEPAGGAGHERSTQNAFLLVEVLSPSSVRTDFSEKLGEYQNLTACRTYLIFDRDVPRAWQWSRRDGLWPEQPRVIESVNELIEVPDPACRLPMREIYRNVT